MLSGYNYNPLHPGILQNVRQTYNSLNLEALEHKRGKPSTKQHSHHDNAEGGGKDELSGGVLCIPDGQGKGNGPSEPSKHQHVLETETDLLSASQVQDEGEHVDVDQSAGKNGHLVTRLRFTGH